jgi:branched-chain amino acid transport system permease protein
MLIRRAQRTPPWAKGAALVLLLLATLFLPLGVDNYLLTLLIAACFLPVLAARTPAWTHRPFLALLLLAMILVPAHANNFYVTVLTNVCVYAVLGLGLNIVVGYAGLLDLGYAAFFAIGAYVTAYMLTTPIIYLGPWTITFPTVPFWVMLPIAAVAAALFGVIIGAPTLRLRSDYLAIVTLGFGEITRISAQNLEWTGGTNGIFAIPQPTIGHFTFSIPLHYYYLIFALLLITLFCVLRLADSRIGRAWAYVREDELAAAAMGINIVKIKLLAYALGAIWGGIAGCFLAVQLSTIDPTSFTFSVSVQILIIVVLGGLGSVPGVCLGALVVVVTPELLRSLPANLINWRLFLFALALIALMIYRPEGLWPSRQRRRELHTADPDVSAIEPTPVLVDALQDH